MITDTEPTMTSITSRVLTFNDKLLGSYIKVREIHWNTYNKASHTLCDDIMGTLIDTSDRLLENLMGLEQRPGFNIINPNIPNTTSLEEILNVLNKESCVLESYLTSPIYSGITNITNDFREAINKYLYLSTLR